MCRILCTLRSTAYIYRRRFDESLYVNIYTDVAYSKTLGKCSLSQPFQLQCILDWRTLSCSVCRSVSFAKQQSKIAHTHTHTKQKQLTRRHRNTILMNLCWSFLVFISIKSYTRNIVLSLERSKTKV